MTLFLGTLCFSLFNDNFCGVFLWDTKLFAVEAMSGSYSGAGIQLGSAGRYDVHLSVEMFQFRMRDISEIKWYGYNGYPWLSPLTTINHY